MFKIINRRQILDPISRKFDILCSKFCKSNLEINKEKLELLDIGSIDFSIYESTTFRVKINW